MTSTTGGSLVQVLMPITDWSILHDSLDLHEVVIIFDKMTAFRICTCFELPFKICLTARI